MVMGILIRLRRRKSRPLTMRSLTIALRLLGHRLVSGLFLVVGKFLIMVSCRRTFFPVSFLIIGLSTILLRPM